MADLDARSRAALSGARKVAGAAFRGTRAMKVVWLGPELLRVGDTEYKVLFDGVRIHAEQSSVNRFLLAKSKSLVESIVDVAPRRVDNLVELGIFKGGSVAFYSQVFAPKHLVAIELLPERVVPLDQFIELHHLEERVHPYYGVSQDDADAVLSILTSHFTPGSLDLVVDDCSHRYRETKASFGLLFGWLRPGGVYVIEDWGWAHWPGLWQEPESPFPAGDPALSNLIFELAILSASRPDLVAEIRILNQAAVITRGPGVVPVEGFDVSAAYLTRGRGFEPRL